MVKRILIILDDDEYEMLRKIKGERTWKDLLIESALTMNAHSECAKVCVDGTKDC